MTRRPRRIHLRQKARDMRNNPTLAERILWSRLRCRQLEGRKFRRQHALAPFIIDFYCRSEKIAVEVDGSTHHEADQKDRDLRRTAYLEERYGVRVLRFPDLLVVNDVEAVLRQIWESFGVEGIKESG